MMARSGFMAVYFTGSWSLGYSILAAKGVTSINYRWRSVNGVVYFLGLARSQEELDKVLALARQMDGVRDVVSHVFIKPS